MTTTSRRSDLHRARPRSVAARRPDAPAAPSGGTTARESLRAGLRSMVHERPEEARRYLEAAATPELLARGDPVAVDALACLSSVRWALADVEGARDDADRALRLGPDRFAPNQKAGEMALRLGDSELAATRFLAALRASEPGTADAKAAEASLREARRRVSRGIRHEAHLPHVAGWLGRLASVGRRRSAGAGSEEAGPGAAGLTAPSLAAAGSRLSHSG
jgi:hypothetical protein